MVFWTVVFACLFLMAAALWGIFSKAGEAGWKSIIPIYGAVVFLRIVGRPWWWLFLLCIPLVGLIVSIVLNFDLARAFGKGGGFAAGLFFLPPVFMALLAFGDATYHRSPKGTQPLARAA